MENQKKINNIDLSIVLPCLNEEKAVKFCLDSITETIQKNNLSAEIIIVDNNSTDDSAKIIKEYQKNNPTINLILVEEKVRGYGSAYQKGFSIAQGSYIFMADLDGTYDFNDIPRFIEKLKEDYDFVIGNRFANNNKNQKKLGSMPWLHRYIGNPILSGIVHLFFGIKIKDIHSGARLIKKESLEKISPNTCGMEFASEMIIKAKRINLLMAEIPIKYNNRIGVSKLESLKDGWRHLRFIFLFSPLFLFLLPGLFLFTIGFISMFILYFTTPSLFNITFYIHPMFISSGFIIAGYQLIFFAFFAKTYAIIHLKEKNIFFEKLYKYITLEKASLFGIFLFIISIIIYSNIFFTWINSSFGPLNEIKNSVLALTLLVLSIQTISSGFMLSIISIREKI